VDLDPLLGHYHIVLIDALIDIQTPWSVKRLPNEVQVDVSLSVLSPQLIVCVVGAIVMVIPHSNHFRLALQLHLLVVYISNVSEMMGLLTRVI
jgi:hypothetical protein